MSSTFGSLRPLTDEELESVDLETLKRSYAQLRKHSAMLITNAERRAAEERHRRIIDRDCRAEKLRAQIADAERKLAELAK